METPKKYGEPDFYIGYLREHLKEHHFDKENTQKFIDNRVDDALDTYTREFASGRPPYICHELAMRTLLEKLYVSRFDIIYHIIEEDCWLRVAPSVWEVTALHFTADKDINAILDKYGVDGGFLEKEGYPAMRLELLGILNEKLDGYEL